jgi:hypothetical protein
MKVLADIAGTGKVEALTKWAKGPRTEWVRVFADPANKSVVRFGGPETSATRGVPVAPGKDFKNVETADLGSYSIYVAAGDKAYVAFG